MYDTIQSEIVENRNTYIIKYFQHLALSDVVMISATAPIFTVFYARIFIKESIVIADLINMVIVFIGIIMVVKPPFLFGLTAMYKEDPEAMYAVVLMVCNSILNQANIYVLMRILKGTMFYKFQSRFRF